MDFRIIIGVLGGLFTVLGGLCDWDWFMNHHKAKFFVDLFGRQGARFFYIALGMGIMILTIASTL